MTRASTRLRYLRSDHRARRTVVYGGGLLVGLGLVWIVVTGVVAARQARDIATRVSEVRGLLSAGRVTEARALAETIPSRADHAHRLCTGPAWFVAAHVPWFGRPFAVVRGATSVVQRLGDDAVPQMVSVSEALSPTTLRNGGSGLHLAPLVASRGELRSVDQLLHRSVAQLDALPHATWLTPVDGLAARLSTQIRALTGYLDAGVRVGDVVPALLGGEGPRRYFIGLQNEAELRGTGGLPGSFAIAVADRGTLRIVRYESAAVLRPAATNGLIDTGLDFGPGYRGLYASSGPTRSINDSNVSPNFPYAAQIWARMWQKVSGEHVDGAMAVDPTVLAYLLAVTGPTTVPGYGPLTADNVVALTQRDEYSIFPGYDERKGFLVDVFRAALRRVLSGAGDPSRLTQVLALAGKQQRIQVWSSDPATERLLEETDFAGAVPRTAQPFVAPIVNNAAAGKLDFYLQRSVDYVRTGCGPTRDVRVTIRLTNSAPSTPLPSYVTDRLDRNPPAGAKPGDNRSLLDYYATSGAQLNGVTIDNSPGTANVQEDLGHPVFRFDLEIPRGATRTVQLHLTEPAGTAPPRVWSQPGVLPLAVSVFDQHC